MAEDDKHTASPLGLPLTENGEVDVKAATHIPDRNEIRELLVRYYEAPITDAVVDRIEDRFNRVQETPGGWMAHHRQFESPTRWRGKAWNEQYSRARQLMTPSDLLLMIANMASDHDASFPRPKRYCPKPFIGIWQQLEPVTSSDTPCSWHLEADGALRTNSPHVPASARYWCVKLAHGAPSGTLVLQDEPGRSLLAIAHIEPTDTELAGVHLGAAENTSFRLRRMASTEGT